jgi:uncharacterized membrane protein
MISEIIQPIIEFIGNPYFIILLLTFLPFLELRASIPYGIFATSISPWIVITLAIVSNIILAPIVYFFLDKIIHLFFYFKSFKKWYQDKLIRAQKKSQKLVDKYGLIGIGIFIGIPLPGSGVYTGALVSYGLNLGYKKFIVAAILGVIIAASIVSIISFGMLSGTNFFAKLFLKQI